MVPLPPPVSNHCRKAGVDGRSTLGTGGPSSGLMGLGWRPPSLGQRAERPPYLVLDVGVDSLQHPLTGVLVGQVGIYLWERWADMQQEEPWVPRPGCRGPAMPSTGTES